MNDQTSSHAYTDNQLTSNSVKKNSNSTLKTFLGDSEQVLHLFPNDYFDSVVCDPPYGLSQKTYQSDFILKTLKAWLNNQSFNTTGTGIAGLNWDLNVPPPSLWKQVFRTMKPGAYLVAFSSSRTDDLLKISLRLAGFEIVDTIAFMHKQGFPRHVDLGRAIEKKLRKWGHTPPANHNDIHEVRENITDTPNGFLDKTQKRSRIAKTIIQPSHQLSEKWNGYNYDLKPAFEPIIIAQKPVWESTVDNLIRYKCGGLNVADCSIVSNDNKPRYPSNVVGDLGTENRKHFYNPFEDGQLENVMCSKPPRKETNSFMHDGQVNNHPTPKSIALMRWLTRLVTPVGGVTLDPFMGSGTGGIAAFQEGFGYVGIELNPEYHCVAEMRFANMIIASTEPAKREDRQ